jgi:RHH-type proline utilization regulon transcriptional repressor/proline dehydrogenase/delta 1-pyrroline-5-carboxylate dehydrogenase
LVRQVRVANAAGNVALVADSASADAVRGETGARVEFVPDLLGAQPDAILFAGTAAAAAELRRQLSMLEGPIVPLMIARAGEYDATRLVSERTLTINTTASGGNASLLSLTETSG